MTINNSMKIHQIILNETFDNYLPGDEDKKRLIADEVFQMLQKSYADKGGLVGSGFTSPEEMIQRIPMWKVYRKGDDIKAVIMYKDKNGRKGVALGTDGSRQGKVAAARMMGAEIEQQRSYSEISGPALKMQKKTLGDKLYDYAVPFDQVKQIMPDEEYKQIDNYSYYRKIGGEWHEKLMLGKAGLKIIANENMKIGDITLNETIDNFLLTMKKNDNIMLSKYMIFFRSRTPRSAVLKAMV